MRYLSLLLLAGLSAACAGGGPLPTAAPASGSLPKAVLDAVARRWKGATVVSARAAATCGSPGVQASPLVAGDFNGDGVPDLALVIQTSDGLRVVAALQETYDYALADVAPIADLSDAVLSVRPRGETFHNPAMTVDDYFGVDTIVVTPCGQPSIAYVWTGQGFSPKELAA